MPQQQHEPPPPPPSESSNASVFAWLGAGALVVALIAAAKFSTRGKNDPTATFASPPWFRIAIPGVAALAIAAAIIAFLRTRYRDNDRVQHLTVPHRAAPWALAFAAFAALIGLASAPLTSRQFGSPSTGGGQPSQPGDFGDRDNPTDVEIGDRDGDGRVDTTYTDRNGRIRYIQMCPEDPDRVMPPIRPGIIPIDQDCDGTIDGYADAKTTEVVDRDGDGQVDDDWDQQPLNDDSGTDPTSSIAWGPLVRILFIFGAVALVAFGLWAILKDVRRRKRPTQVAVPLRSDVQHGAIEDAVAALLADPRPRQAIIGAYASMLRSLEHAGLPRLAHEAPREHLGRAFAEHDLPHEPFNELVGLFEIARFSSRDVTEADRDRALAALNAIRTPSPQNEPSLA